MPQVEVNIINQLYTSEAELYIRGHYQNLGEIYGSYTSFNKYGTWALFYLEIINSSDSTVSVIDFILSYDGIDAPSMPHVNFDKHLYTYKFPIEDQYTGGRFDLHLSSSEYILPNTAKKLVVSFNLPRISKTEYYAADTTAYTVTAVQRNLFTGEVMVLTTTTLDLTQTAKP